ncbi:MAG: DMT family transporter [Pararhodobacter sp.]|nr:DMT family transporter [Pararhodobacter sp.]
MTSQKALFLAVLAAAGLVLSLASSFPAIAIALQSYEPLPLAALRLTLAALAGVFFLVVTLPQGIDMRAAVKVIAAGLLVSAAFVLGNTGQLTVSIGAASFLLGMQPLYMALFSVLLLREVFGPRNWLGLGVSFAGLALISVGQPHGLQFGAGATLLVAAALSNAASALVQRPLLVVFNPLRLSALIFIAGAFWLSPWLAQGIRQLSVAPVGPTLAVVYLALVPTFAGQICLAYTIRFLGVARAGVMFYLIPVVATAIAWIGLGQRPELATIAGGACILVGVVLASRARRVPRVEVGEPG